MDHYRGRIKLNYGNLVINGKRFGVQDLGNLPADLNLRSLCENADSDVITFFGQCSPFSNFFPSMMKINGTSYSCSEQYIQAKKAEIFNDDKTKMKILQSKIPKDMKFLGSKVAGFIQQFWERDYAKEICATALLEKFSQIMT